MKLSFESIILDHARVVLSLKDQFSVINRIIQVMVQALKSGNAIYIFGNGGSAADANHFAAELAGRFYIENRKGLSVFSLVANTSTLTAIANDFGYEYAFSKQIDAHAKQGDIVVGITTSGKSKNIISALAMGRRMKCVTIALTGRLFDPISQYSDIILPIDSSVTPRIQEVHTLILHTIAESVEEKCCNDSSSFFPKMHAPELTVSSFIPEDSQ